MCVWSCVPLLVCVNPSVCVCARAQLGHGRALELMESQLSLFLSVWGDFIRGHASLQAACARVTATHGAAWGKLQVLLQYNLCLIQHFSNLQ